VESKKGEGTMFKVYLPASANTIAKEDKSHDQVVQGSETILLVDDEDMILHVAGQMLEKIGYKVLKAKSGKEAMETYRKNIGQIHLVLLDMIMPDMNGGETYDNLKEIDPGVKVLLSSGYSLDARAADILNRGCRGFIQKPFNMEQLSIRIKECLELK